MNPTDEHPLITRTQAGETEALAPLFEKYQPRIYHQILAQVRDVETAKDLTQETWLKALRAIKNFRGDAAFSSWLYRIAENVITDYFHKQKHRDTVNTQNKKS